MANTSKWSNGTNEFFGCQPIEVFDKNQKVSAFLVENGDLDQ